MSSLVRLYVQHLIAARRAQRTVQTYESELRQLVAWLHDRRIALSDCTTLHLEEWLASKPLAAATAARRVVTLRGFFKWAHANDLVMRDPSGALPKPKRGRRLPRVLSVEQVQRLLGHVRQSGSYSGIRAAAMIWMAYATGARTSELLGLRLEDVDGGRDPGVVMLHGKGDKARRAFFPAAVSPVLSRWMHARDLRLRELGASSPWVFTARSGEQLRRTASTRWIRIAFDRAEMPSGASLHWLRHSFATHLMDGGAGLRQVQELLGHASVATTEIYTHVTQAGLESAYRDSHPLA